MALSSNQSLKAFVSLARVFARALKTPRLQNVALHACDGNVFLLKCFTNIIAPEFSQLVQKIALQKRSH